MPQDVGIELVSVSHVRKLLRFLLKLLVAARNEAIERLLTSVHPHVVIHGMNRGALPAAHMTLIAANSRPISLAAGFHCLERSTQRRLIVP